MGGVGGDFLGSPAEEGADVGGFGVSFDVGFEEVGGVTADRGGDVGVVGADDDEDGAGWDFDVDALGKHRVEDLAGFVAPFFMRPEDGFFVGIGHGGAGVFEGAVFPLLDWREIEAFDGIDNVFGGDRVDEDDGGGVDLFGED